MLVSMDPDGMCAIRRINFRSEFSDSFEVKCEEMLREYLQQNSRNVPEVLRVHADHMKDNDEWATSIAKAKVTIALDLVYAKYASTATHVVVRLSPKAVFAGGAMKRNECVMVPTTMKIKVADEGDSNRDPLFMCDADGQDVEICPSFSVTKPVPAWYVNPTSDKKRANIKISMGKVSVDMKLAKNTSESTVAIPVLVNTRAVSEGDELMYYSDASASRSQGVKRPFDLI